MLIGYARVSTEDQTLALQLDALQGAGCDAVHEDHGVSGVAKRRPGLLAALDAAKAGDVLVVWKLDRLGRSQRELVNLIEDLKGRGVGLKVLAGEGVAIDTTQAHGRMIFGIFAAIAEFERELIRERTSAGMKAAGRRGIHLGRPAKLTAHQVAHVRGLIAAGQETQAGAAALVGVDVTTLRRHLNKGRR